MLSSRNNSFELNGHLEEETDDPRELLKTLPQKETRQKVKHHIVELCFTMHTLFSVFGTRFTPLKNEEYLREGLGGYTPAQAKTATGVKDAGHKPGFSLTSDHKRK